MKQTAVDWVFEKMNVLTDINIPTSVSASKEVWEEIYKKAKEMEKQQIMQTWNDCIFSLIVFNEDVEDEQYYQETYGKDA